MGLEGGASLEEADTGGTSGKSAFCPFLVLCLSLLPGHHEGNSSALMHLFHHGVLPCQRPMEAELNHLGLKL